MGWLFWLTYLITSFKLQTNFGGDRCINLRKQSRWTLRMCSYFSYVSVQKSTCQSSILQHWWQWPSLEMPLECCLTTINKMRCCGYVSGDRMCQQHTRESRSHGNEYHKTTHKEQDTHIVSNTLCSRRRGHLICASHQYNLNQCDSYIMLIQERLIGNKREAHLLSCFPWHGWHSQGWGYLLLCVCVCGFQEVCLRKVTGWDRHVKNPLGLCGLSGPHTFLPSFFSHAIHLCTQKDTQIHTPSWIICHADLLS